MTRMPRVIPMLAASLLVFASGRSGATPIDAMAWLAGCWARAGGETTIEEQWMAPRGATMLGMSRTVRSGETVGFESLRINEDGAQLVYVSLPSGQTLTEFRSTFVADTMTVFENLQHDYPQRIIYRYGAGDSLWARIEGSVDGVLRGSDFRMGRVGCPG